MSERDAVLKLLAATPRRIRAATKGLSGEELKRKPAADSWSVNEVLAHLRACADMWGRSIMTMLAGDCPTFRYLSPRTWIKKTDYCAIEFEESFRAFVKQRKNLMQVLGPLPPEDWLRGGAVKASTKLRQETVLSYTLRLARHEASHCEQIERIVGTVAAKNGPLRTA